MRSGRIGGVVAVLAFAAAASVAEEARGGAPAIEELAWLEGSWYGVEKGLGTEEHWTSPAGGGMVGMHKEIRGEKMTGFEFLRIAQIESGGLGYVASPGGAPPSTFPLKESGERRVVFENPDHDFPQRIIYWLDDAGTLHARIEGLSDGRIASIEWTWRRR